MPVVTFGTVPPCVCAGIEHCVIKNHEITLDLPLLTAVENSLPAFGGVRLGAQAEGLIFSQVLHVNM